jgi:hypothetical protein
MVKIKTFSETDKSFRRGEKWMRKGMKKQKMRDEIVKEEKLETRIKEGKD